MVVLSLMISALECDQMFSRVGAKAHQAVVARQPGPDLAHRRLLGVRMGLRSSRIRETPYSMSCELCQPFQLTS